ncbi:MAG: response regulator [SAR324 cluster bacterium]|nr:response regulator [SAR324 cluster bacterium]MCZ6644968.1 response regulator [SAR324 cluster bacterium]
MAARIVLAEDDLDAAEMLKVLIENAGYDIVSEETGSTAWERIAKDLPDLVILDWDMPGMTGLEVLKKMREKPETKEIPVIFFTANKDEWDPRISMLYNIEAYLIKPVNHDELLKNISQVIKRS